MYKNFLFYLKHTLLGRNTETKSKKIPLGIIIEVMELLMLRNFTHNRPMCRNAQRPRLSFYYAGIAEETSVRKCNKSTYLKQNNVIDA